MKESFVFYKGWMEALTDVPDDIRLEVYDCIIEYAFSGKVPSLKPMAKMAFNFIKNDIDRASEKYAKTVERNRINGKSGGRPKNPNNPVGFNETQQNPNDNEHDNGNDKKEYKYSFVKVSDFEESLNSFTLNKSYFYIAYRFWELWFKDNETKTLKDAMIINWYDAVRLIIETDKQKIDRLISVYEYFKKCQLQEPGFKTFWFETVKTIASFRKKDKEGVYYLDKIMEDVNKKIQTDSAFSQLVFSQIDKFKKYERSKLFTQQN